MPPDPRKEAMHPHLPRGEGWASENDGMNRRKLTACIRIAFRALRINRMRSALTILGIVIGVAAVIAMVAVGSGAQVRIREQIASIGSNVIIVLSGSVT